MRIKLNYIAPLLATGAAAVAITVAPIASAASAPTHGACDAGVSGSICETPGNVEINDSPPAVNYDPYGDDGFLLGYGGGFRGGFPGGGFGGGGFHGGGGGHGR
jgi:hypothetical protein